MSIHDTRIERGMTLLDEKAPGWEHRLDLRALDVGSCTQCVVGQLFGVRDNELLYLGFQALGVERPREYGFSLDWTLGYRATYGGLTTAWKRKIRERRCAARRDG
jgi:hypothetical protein